MRRLLDKDFRLANIVFKESNWDKKYTERERTYQVCSDDNFFDKTSYSNSLYGTCLDGKDKGVRLDKYGWEVERVDILL